MKILEQIAHIKLRSKPHAINLCKAVYLTIILFGGAAAIGEYFSLPWLVLGSLLSGFVVMTAVGVYYSRKLEAIRQEYEPAPE